MPTQAEIDTNMKNMANKLGQGYNATTGQMIDTTKPIVDKLPEGNNAQRDANINIRNQATADKLGQTYNVDTQQFEAGPTALEIQRNKEQAAFNQKNQVGTRVEDIKYTPESQIADVQAFKPSTTPVTTPQATTTSPTSTTHVKTQINGSSQTNEQGVPLINGKTQAEWDSSKGRDAEITSNLTNITQQNPSILDSRESFNKSFSYSTADEGKKALLDSFFNNAQKQKTTLATLNKWRGESVNDISASLLDGTLSPSTYNTLISDPTIADNIKKAELLNKANGLKADQTTAGLKQTAEVLASSPTLDKKLADGDLSVADVNALTTSPEMEALNKKKISQQDEVSTLTAKWDAIENDINAKYAGSGATASDVAQIIANARKLLLPELNRAERNLNNTIGNLTEMKKEALSVLDTNLKLYTSRQAEAADIKKEERQRANALIQNQAEFEQKIKQQAQLASDPYTAILTVMDQYNKLGIPFTQSIATKVADAQKFIASGGTIGEYVDKMIGDIQKKPEWKTIQDSKLNEKYKPFSVGKDSVVFDPSTGKYIYQSGISTPSTSGSGVSVTSGTTKNRPDRNNNPGNVKIGDVGYGVDDQRHTIFGNAQDGYAAMVKDITAKLTGGSSQKSRLTGKILAPTSTLADLGSVYAEDPKWAQSVARLSGYPTNTQLSQIDVNVLAPAIAKQEGFTGSINAGEDVGTIDQASGAPLVYARRIKSMVPVQLQNSDIEAKNLNNVISTLYKEGVSPEDAILSYMGVEFKPEKKAIGLKMIDAIKGYDVQPNVYTAIADKLNSGNDSGAVQTLENALYGTKGIKTNEITDIGTNVKSGNKLLERISALKNKFGPIAGKTEQWGQVLQDDKETQRLLSDMTNFVAKYRNGIAGTSVTANEEDFLNDIIPSLTNNPENAMAKIESNIGQAFSGLNTIRDQVGLPTLQDPRSAYDIEFRKQAFTGRGQPTAPATKPTQENKYNLDYNALAKILTQ